MNFLWFFFNWKTLKNIEIFWGKKWLNYTYYDKSAKYETIKKMLFIREEKTCYKEEELKENKLTFIFKNCHD